jgi:hypothetical protein
MLPYQYQVGAVVFGDLTNYPVSKVEIQTYNVNNQDFQIIHSDETRFGIDNLVPASIIFTMAVLNNWALDNIPGGPASPSFLYNSRSLLGQLANEWKDPSVRTNWGATKILTFSDEDGIVRRIYGRPGKFTHGPVEQQEWVDVQCEFRRADTYAYEDVETMQEIVVNADPIYIFRDRGDSPAWLRVLCYGPMTNPVITIGSAQIELLLNIAADVVVEISSYPWMRRVVDSNGYNWRAALIGNTPYLDMLKIAPATNVPLRVTNPSNLATWTELPHTNVVENTEFMSSFKLQGWHVLTGMPMWNSSEANGGYVYAPYGVTAILDNNHNFNTANQCAEVRIADMWLGSSSIVIMCNDDVTNFVAAQSVKDSNGDKLRIVSGSAPDALTTQAEYLVPDPGLASGDSFGVTSDAENNMFYLLYNRTQVGDWHDNKNVVNQDNRRQGLILNSDNDSANYGVGLNDIVAYDKNIGKSAVARKTSLGDLSSRVFLLWRETWNIV